MLIDRLHACVTFDLTNLQFIPKYKATNGKEQKLEVEDQEDTSNLCFLYKTNFGNNHC